MGVEPTMSDLQSDALATWLQRHDLCDRVERVRQLQLLNLLPRPDLSKLRDRAGRVKCTFGIGQGAPAT